MREVDLTGNDRIALVVEIVRDASRVEDPVNFGRQFGRRFRRLRPNDLYLGVSVRHLEPGCYKITRVIDPVSDGLSEETVANPWRDWDLLPTHRGGFIGSVIGRPVPRLFHDLSLGDDPILGERLREMGSCIAMPLFDNAEALNWNFMFFRDPRVPTPDTVEEMMLFANLLGTATRNLVALEEVRRLHALQRAQFEEIARLQQSLLPAAVPEIPGLRIATSYLTSDEAGGDYYDFFSFEDGRWGILIADVSGHGAAAATVMAMLHAILHSCTDRSPDAVLRYANNRLHGRLVDGSFVTAFYAVYDPGEAELAYCCCGHNPPRLKSGRTGEISSLNGASTYPLGIAPDVPARSARVRLAMNDTVILYTDGITEAFDPGRAMFGVGGLDAALAACDGNPECVVDSVHGALYRHTGSWTRDDDQTLVAIRLVGDAT